MGGRERIHNNMIHYNVFRTNTYFARYRETYGVYPRRTSQGCVALPYYFRVEPEHNQDSSVGTSHFPKMAKQNIAASWRFHCVEEAINTALLKKQHLQVTSPTCCTTTS
jgi:hypothetical protein